MVQAVRRWIPPWVIPVILVFATGTVWLRLMIVRTTYSISQVEKEIRKIQQEKEGLQIRVSALRSPRRLDALARSKFGYSSPNSNQFVHIDLEGKE